MHEAIFSDEFKEQLGKLKKKDKAMYERMEKKIRAILIEPTHLKYLNAKIPRWNLACSRTSMMLMHHAPSL